MQVLTSDSTEWIEPTQDGGEAVDRRLRQLLGAERFVVLTGLGTSRGVMSRDGARTAPDMADLWQRAQDAVGSSAWTKALEIAKWREDFDDDIELLLSRCQMALSLSADEPLHRFIVQCEREIAEACRFVDPDSALPVHETFLRRIARRPARLPRTQIFTTNYDLAFEMAASRTGFAVIDGFSHTAPQRFDSGYFDVDLAVRDRDRAATALEWMPNVVQLLKLHGSVDWASTDEGIVRQHAPARPLIVYPRADKFEVSYQQPFLELMARLQAALRRADTGLLIVGSGLRDRHIVEPVLAAIRTNVRLSMVLVSPGLAANPSEDVNAMIRLIQRGDRRITLMAATFEELVGILPDLMPETEAEIHAQRLLP